MNISNLSIIILIALFALVYMIYQNVNEPLTERSYVTTTYFYVLIAILLIVLINDTNFVRIEYGAKFFAMALLALVLIFALKMVPTENQFMKHVIWIAFVGIMALFLTPVIDIAKEQNILNKVLLTVGIMFIGMTYFAYTKPLGYLNTWQPYLYTGLLALIVVELGDLIFGTPGSSGFNTRSFLYSCIAIVLFNGFLFFDTQKIQQDTSYLSRICVQKDHLVCADYPDKSLNVFLDLLNLFTSTTNVYSTR